MSEPTVIDGEYVEEDALPSVREPAPSTALVARDQMSVDELLKQAGIIEAAMQQAMTPEVHYGHIPGIRKPTLLKPGAEKLNVLFRLAPSYQSDKTWHEDGHLTVVTKCILTHIPSSLVVGEGEGLCTTKESKYAYRQAGRVCPACGVEAIIKGKAEYGGGWICFKKKGGCGEKFADDSPEGAAFEKAETGKVANEDLADSYNTVLKMAAKRALIAGVLNCTAASDIFTQDVEDGGGRTETTAGGTSEAKSQSSQQREFDPAKDLMPGAIKGDNHVARLAEALNALDSSIDWEDVMAQAVQGVWSARGSRKDLTEGERPEFWLRLANAVEWITQTQGQAEWPTEAQIQGGFGWAFNGVKVELTAKASDAALSPEQVAEVDRLEEQYGDQVKGEV